MPDLSEHRLQEIVSELVTRPGHEKVRALVYELLVSGLGADSSNIAFEHPLPEVRGRVDALLGSTVFEFKRDLRAEKRDAEEELGRYLRQRESETGDRFIGIATDGAQFLPYERRDGELVALAPFQPAVGEPRALLVWLDTAVSIRPELPPDAFTVQRELGRESLTYQRAIARLTALWNEVRGHPDVEVKRKLWDDLLQKVYGAAIGADGLFLQHTYLTIVAKTMAARVLDIATTDAEELLSGRPFADAGIVGAVESDFFDWILTASDGADLVARIARQVSRFRLRDVETDVLKSLYESLIDPEQRHDLGEYYTPDWLAARMCGEAIDEPLNRRVLDPACGSGTFLFHAIRRFLAAADEARISNADALARCADSVIGIDVHPVAVLFARVTYLLALGVQRLRRRPPTLAIPVYLGDSLQWNTRPFLSEREILIEVPDGPVLHFPSSVAEHPGRLDAAIAAMLRYCQDDAAPEAFRAWLDLDLDLPAHDAAMLTTAYGNLRDLHRSGRDHIWGYVARNLVRPLWLSAPEQQADVVIGNPPWLSYRYMAREQQQRFREACRNRNLWAGGRFATHQDLSAFFFAKCAELYLRDGGRIAFVMPYAAMTRAQFRGFRTGDFGAVQVRFEQAWAFDDDVQPLFPVPSCALFARRAPAGPLPDRIEACQGRLARRDATPREAAMALRWRSAAWPAEAALQGGSAYRSAFRQGATMVPRRLCVVERVESGRLGANPAAPLVESRTSGLDKMPWRDLPPIRQPVEAEFLRPLYLGESIAPFRPLDPVLSVIPWHERSNRLLDAAGARAAGLPHLARWMDDAESLWNEHGRGRMPLNERWNFHGGLSNQFPTSALRVAYAKAGTLPAAAVLRDATALIDHKLYWCAVESEREAGYLAAILNSEHLRQRIAHLQSRGQWGARDFDKVVFEQPIPRFEARNDIHSALAAQADHAERIAGGVEITEGMHFTRIRRRIRDALTEDGVSARIDALVAALLGPA